MAQPVAPPGPAPARRVRVVFDVEERPGQFLLDEDDVPETPLHDLSIDLLKSLLLAWVARVGRSALVARNLACRWDPHDARIGVDPDLALIEPAPPGGEELTSLRVWEHGHEPPRLAVEVVSAATADKDYRELAVRYGLLGAREVWAFDPLLRGPSDTGGPFVLQVWRRQGDTGAPMQRVYAGPGPARSDELQAWMVVTDEGKRLRLSDDASGQRLWPTQAEALAWQQVQAAREQERAAREQALAAREEAEAARARAEAEVEALRAELARLKSERG